MLRSYRDSSHFSWYDWNTKNWGTKWGAYDVVSVEPRVLRFETAWSAPHPVIKELAKKGGPLLHEWADEDTGNNVGYIRYNSHGEPIEEFELSGTKEGMELAMSLHGNEELYRWDEDKDEYVYIEED
jgi:hypothetical protein